MENQISNHLGEERLEAYARNVLQEEEVTPVEEHLLFCSACQDRLETLERYVRAMRTASARIAEEEKTAPVPASLWDRVKERFRLPAIPVWIGAAALVTVLVSVGVRVEPPPGPAVDVQLQALRGTSSESVPKGHALHLKLDTHGIPELPAWKIEIVDFEGRRVWSGTGSTVQYTVSALVNQSFRPGTYFIRLFQNGTPGHDPAREYMLVVE